jgi:hypothetical protein
MRDVKSLALFILLVFAALLFPACISLGNFGRQSTGGGSLLTGDSLGNAQSGLVIVGVSGRLSSRDETIRSALNDAARKLSFFYAVSGFSISREHIGAGTLEVFIDAQYQLLYDDDLEKYLEQLDYNLDTDVIEDNNALFITTRVNSGASMPRFQGHSSTQRRPSWVDSPPEEIGGYIVGVGFSGRLDSHRNTVVRSYERAVIAIIENIERSITREHVLYQDLSTFGFELRSLGEARAQGTINNFYVIESWVDPANLSVWTLAVARRGL